VTPEATVAAEHYGAVHDGECVLAVMVAAMLFPGGAALAAGVNRHAGGPGPIRPPNCPPRSKSAKILPGAVGLPDPRD
jgi:hypothetical protein